MYFLVNISFFAAEAFKFFVELYILQNHLILALFILNLLCFLFSVWLSRKQLMMLMKKILLFFKFISRLQQLWNTKHIQVNLGLITSLLLGDCLASALGWVLSLLWSSFGWFCALEQTWSNLLGGRENENKTCKLKNNLLTSNKALNLVRKLLKNLLFTLIMARKEKLFKHC